MCINVIIDGGHCDDHKYHESQVRRHQRPFETKVLDSIKYLLRCHPEVVISDQNHNIKLHDC